MGAILMGKGMKNAKGATGGQNNIKGAKILKSIIESTSIAYYYHLLVSCKFLFTMIIVAACC